jgi:amino acid permease
VAVAAGESAKPHKSVPRAIKATFFRIVIFYILTILTIGLCINHADDTLLTAAFGELAHNLNDLLLTLRHL